MIEKANGAPAANDPVITLAGQTYSLRFSFIAQYEADKLKVNLRDFVGGLRTNNAGTLSTFVALFAAMVAHNFTAMGQPVPTPDYWVGLLDGQTAEKRGEVFQLVADVLAAWLKKRASEVIKLQEPAPPQEQGEPILN
jgi:hypothetical protein